MPIYAGTRDSVCADEDSHIVLDSRVDSGIVTGALEQFYKIYQ